MQQVVFQIKIMDNVATALGSLEIGSVELRGDTSSSDILAKEQISMGHKIALKDIESGENIIKYGVVIGRATKDIKKGTWVHLHCMESLYDERSSSLDVVTGAPKDISYD